MIRDEINIMNEKAKKRRRKIGIIAVNLVFAIMSIFFLLCSFALDEAFKGLTDDDLTRCKVTDVKQEFIEKKVEEYYKGDGDYTHSITYIYDVSCNLTFTYLNKERTYPYTFRHEISAANGENWKTDLYDGMEKDFFIVVDVKNDKLSSVREDKRERVPVYRTVFLIFAGVTILIWVVIDVVIIVKARRKWKNKIYESKRNWY